MLMTPAAIKAFVLLSPDPILVLDLDDRVRVANPSAARLLVMESGRQKFLASLHPASYNAATHMLARARAGETSTRVVLWHDVPGSGWVGISYSCFPLAPEGAETSGHTRFIGLHGQFVESEAERTPLHELCG